MSSNQTLNTALDKQQEAYENAYSSLDGKHPVKPTPFDAHDQKVRGEHVPTSADSPDKDPETVQEFPKAVAHDETTGEPVIARDAAHEAELKAKVKAEEKASE
jgi:hypothetical protein